MILSLKEHCFAALQAICSGRRDTTARSGHGWNRNQLSHPHQVISRCREGENPSRLEQSAMFQFAQQRDVFQPTEALLDPLPFLLTDVVTGMPRGARIDGAAAAPLVVLRHVRGHVHVAALVDDPAVSNPLSPPTVMRLSPGRAPASKAPHRARPAR
jgi:hypothetical protein